MFHSLAVKNYRCLKDLEIDSLGRVNLIVGMNNTGKSSLLEAVALYASKGDVSFIRQLLEEHGEFAKHDGESQRTKNLEDITAKTLASLFTDRAFGFCDENAIVIGNIGEASPETTLSMRFVRYRLERDEVFKGFVVQNRIALSDEEASRAEGVELAMEINASGDTHHLFFDPFSKIRSFDWTLNELKSFVSFQFVRAGHINRKSNGSLFDNIALTTKVNHFLEALRIIEPAIDGIAFIEEGKSERAAVVKLSGADSTVPLRSMGDGINRILTIVLALINAENGFLLIDEFENGLYYTAQGQLWKMIFLLAERLNVQVFATTHSEDCIRGFGRVLNTPENQTTGKLVRLEKKKGMIRSVSYDKRELQIADEQDIEVR